ncbi:MAG: DUF1049 domain-containing protein [Parvibaculum sp.]|nr:DUF1049 domain-containing protein [Parvibaculum sp.]
MKILRWILLPPVILLAMALAVANRSTVTFSLDPFDPETPALGIDVPLFLIVLVSVLFGILAGGFGAWTQARRKAARIKAAAPAGGGLPALRNTDGD